MRATLAIATLLIPFLSADATLTSPDGAIRVEFTVDEAGMPRYGITRAGETVLASSELGLVRDDADLARGLTLLCSSPIEPVTDRYELLTGKKRHVTYRANRQVHELADAHGVRVDVIFQVSDDGVAFRYALPATSGPAATAPRTILEERSSFRFPAGTRAWLQPMSVAKSGWKRTNPSYEENYEMDVPAGTPSTLGAGWVFPALFRTGATWVALTETAVEASDCGARLRHESPGGEYRIGFPDPRETRDGRPVTPVVRLPWVSPWRVLALGDLATVTESTLGTDLAAPARVAAGADWLRPGKASWSWPLLGDKQTVFPVQRDFVDFAARMGWAYCLVDALWDTQIRMEKIAELAAYARTKGVGLLLWYNTNGDWNDAPQTPKDRMHTPEARRAEFARLRALGIKGVKVDFFGGDGPAAIELYHEILHDAAQAGLLVNFHGATLPRGWTRTYPNLMTVEAIKGFEFITFEQENADRQPAHCAMIPFTRNLFEAMDFTPLCLGPLPGGKVRRTTVAFELALTVLFTSGIQHYPELPARMAEQPAAVQDFLRRVPSVWEDSKFLDGEPGRHVTLARRGEDGRWFVAGVNGEAQSRELALDLARIAPAGTGRLFADDGLGGFAERSVRWAAGDKLSLTLPAAGGFVLILD